MGAWLKTSFHLLQHRDQMGRTVFGTASMERRRGEMGLEANGESTSGERRVLPMVLVG